MNINTYREYQKTFAEIDFILNNTDEKVRSRIPEEFKKLIKNNLDKEYEVNINLESGLESCTLLPKTKDVLSLIYRDYLCTKEEKEELNKIWKTKNKKI